MEHSQKIINNRGRNERGKKREKKERGRVAKEDTVEARKTDKYESKREPHPKKRLDEKPQEVPQEKDKKQSGEKKRNEERWTKNQEAKERPKAETSNKVRTHKGEEEAHKGKGPQPRSKVQNLKWPGVERHRDKKIYTRNGEPPNEGRKP